MATIFISYAREDEDLAEDLYHALEKSGHTAILDKKALAKGEEYNVEIRRLIDSADFFLFLISPEAVSQGAYARTELGFAEEKWSKNRAGFLPVMIRETDPKQLPGFLRQSTWLKPSGNITAEVVAEFNRKQVDYTNYNTSITDGRTQRAKSYFDIGLEGRDRYYRVMAARNRHQFQVTQALIVAVALSLPMLSSYPLGQPFVTMLQIVLAALLVVAVVLNLLGNPQVKAMRYSYAAERMAREFRMYCNAVAPYSAGLGEGRAYQLFVEGIEQTIQDADRE